MQELTQNTIKTVNGEKPDQNGNIEIKVGKEEPLSQEFGLIWMKWTNNLEIGNGIENDAILYANHDIVLTQRLGLNELASSRPMLTSKSAKILQRAKELNPKLRSFEYIQSDSGRTDFKYENDYAHLNPDGSWEGSTADLSGSTRIYTFDQFCDWFDFFKATGADGIFFDDWGYDFAKEDICYQFGWNVDEIADLNEAKNKKWTALIDACHERGLAVITNGGTPFGVGDWYTHLNENDVICLESCMITSAGNAWNTGHKSIYDYYANWYSTGKCAAKLWALAYSPGGSEEFRNQILTYVCAMGLACGAHYISVGVGRCLEKPFFVDVFTQGDQKAITKIDDNVYQLKVGKHNLEVHRWSGLNGVVSENNISKNYYFYDGRPFNNAFTIAPSVDYLLSGKVESLEGVIDNMTEDTRKNASSYWRIAIDDWQPDLTYLDYTNLIVNTTNIKTNSSAAKPTLVKNDDETFDLVIEYTNCKQANISFDIITSSNYESLKLTGEGLEYGFSDVIFETDEGSWTLPNGTAYYGASLWAEPSFRPYFGYTLDGTTKWVEWIKGVGSEIGETNGHYEKIGNGEITLVQAYVWIKTPASMPISGTVTLKNIYLVDSGEHSDEISKRWYTNIFPTSWNVRSALDVVESPAKKQGWSVFDIVVTTGNIWGWSVYKFSGDEVIALRGHTIELGCSSMVFSNGYDGHTKENGINYAFGIGINIDTPTSYRLYSDTSVESSTWGEKLICTTCTIPADATSVCVGFRSYGYPSGTVTLKDVYLYDLEEDVAIRGKAKTNASLRLCRVNEEQEALTPSNMRNALYFTEKGSVYCYDLKGNKTDLAGSIYVGAVEAGYAGTPREFGAEIYNKILKST